MIQIVVSAKSYIENYMYYIQEQNISLDWLSVLLDKELPFRSWFLKALDSTDLPRNLQLADIKGNLSIQDLILIQYKE